MFDPTYNDDFWSGWFIDWSEGHRATEPQSTRKHQKFDDDWLTDWMDDWLVIGDLVRMMSNFESLSKKRSCDDEKEMWDDDNDDEVNNADDEDDDGGSPFVLVSVGIFLSQVSAKL